MFETENILYIFLDEGGNPDFSPSGTKYFTLTGISKIRPFYASKDLSELRYDVIEDGIELEYFHASEDKQSVRDKVFNIIQQHIKQIRINSLIIEKSKTNPELREAEHFYPKMLGYLLKYIIGGYKLEQLKKVIIFTDALPVKRKRNAVEKAIRTYISSVLPPSMSYTLLHHQSKSNMDLQIVDYCNWAIFRKWERGDYRSYELIKNAVGSEFNIFKTGNNHYYKK